MMKTVLVCGGTGFAGKRIVEELIDAGYETTIATRGRRSNPFGTAVKQIVLERKDIKSIERASIANPYYDVIIDTIAMSSGDVFNLLGYFKCQKYIQISSMAVYYGDMPVDGFAETAFNPLEGSGYNHFLDNESRLYHRGKRFAECAAAQMFAHYKPVFIRPAYVADTLDLEHTGNNRLQFFVTRIEKEIPIQSQYNDYMCVFTLTTEEACATVGAIEDDECGALNVASIGSITIGQIIEYVETKVGKKAVYSEDGERPPFTGRDFRPPFTGRVLNLDKLCSKYEDVSKVTDYIFDMLDYYVGRMKFISENNDYERK